MSATINRKTVLEVMCTKSKKEMLEWIKSLEDEDALKACTLMKKISMESPLYQTDPEFRKQVDDSQQQIDKYEEAISKEVAAKLIQEIELDQAFKKADESYDAMRRILQNEMEKSPENLERLKVIALGLINIEKEHDLYEPEKWKRFLAMI